MKGFNNPRNHFLKFGTGNFVSLFFILKILNQIRDFNGQKRFKNFNINESLTVSKFSSGLLNINTVILLRILN